MICILLAYSPAVFAQSYRGYILASVNDEKFVVKAGSWTWFLEAMTYCFNFDEGDFVLVIGSPVSVSVKMINLNSGDKCDCWLEEAK